MEKQSAWIKFKTRKEKQFKNISYKRKNIRTKINCLQI